MLFAQVVEKAAEQSVTSIIRETMLGAIAVGACLLAIWAIRSLKTVQDDRVSDKEKDATRQETQNDKDRLVQGEQTKAIAALAEAQREHTRALERNTTAMDANTRAVDGVVREAVSGRRATGISGGFPAARGKPRPEPPEGG